MKLEQRLQERFGTEGPAITSGVAPEGIDRMLGHRSCREFTSQPVDRDIANLVLAAALSSPSKSDLQQATVIWLTDPALRRSVVGLSPTNSWALTAPEVFVFCADGRRIRRAAELLERDFPNDNLDQFMNATVDCGIVLGAAIQAAEAYGLGACPISELRDEAGKLIEMLKLPAYVVPVAGLAVGWPAAPERPVTPRLPFGVTVQQNAYSDDSFDATIAGYERLRDATEDRPDAEQRDVERFGQSRPYGWAEDRTRQYSKPRRADWGEQVRSQGFGLS